MSTDNRTLFDVSPADVALTTDDWYTPRWLFDAAGLVFDMDVCAPVDPAYRTCPAREYLTVVEDGLTAPWHGLVWMNPPYSRAAPWIDRFAGHLEGMALLPAMPEVYWLGTLLRAAEGIALVSCDFGRADGSSARLRWPLILAARGAASIRALARAAAADRYIRGAYHLSILH